MSFYKYLVVACYSYCFLSVLNAQELKVQEKDFADIVYESLRTGEKKSVFREESIIWHWKEANRFI